MCRGSQSSCAETKLSASSSNDEAPPPPATITPVRTVALEAHHLVDLPPHESERRLRGDDVNVDRLTEARLQPALLTLEIERRLVAHVSDNLDRPGSLRPTRTGR